MKPEKLNAEQLETVRAELREWMPKGSTVYTILRHVARSGMQRLISPVFFEVRKEQHENCALAFHHVAEPRFPEYKVAQVLGRTLGKHEGIVVRGCGMDMGFELVYSLSAALYGDGYALKHRWL